MCSGGGQRWGFQRARGLRLGLPANQRAKSVCVLTLAALPVQGGVDDLTEVGVMVVGGMCGLSAGNLLSKHVNAASFRKAMVVLIAMSSASLITSQAAAEVQLWTTVAFAVLSVGYSLRQHMFEHYVSAEQPYAAVAQTVRANLPGATAQVQARRRLRRIHVLLLLLPAAAAAPADGACFGPS